MKEQIPMGMNRTGLQMSPFDAGQMQSGYQQPGVGITPGDESSMTAMRCEYIAEAEPIGSVPIPGSVKGALTTGFSMLTGNQPQLLLDKLGERLAFERTGTRLYDALIAKFQAAGEQGVTSMSMDDLLKIREDEARHFAILANAITTVGADPTAQTPCADLAGVESMGLMQVLTDPRTSLAQSLHAILVAEMTDNAGWEMLIMLADDQGQSAMIPEFTVALDEERQHLQMVQAWFEEATLGAAVSNVAEDSDVTPSQLH